MTAKEEYYMLYEKFETEVLRTEYKRLENRVGDVNIDQIRLIIEDIMLSRGKEL